LRGRLDHNILGIAWLTKIIAALVLAYLSYLLLRLAGYDGLSSVANDSVNYLIMARHYSPWLPETPAVAALWPAQDFPPLFPLLLAASGASQNLMLAHVLVILLGFAGLYAMFLTAHKMSGDRALAFATVLVLALSPGFILSLQGILSESLYLLLSLMFLCLAGERPEEGRRYLILAVLLCLAMLSRTVGLVLWLALICQGLVQAIQYRSLPRHTAMTAILALVLYLLASQVAGPIKESHYSHELTRFLAGQGGGGIGVGWDAAFSQLQSLVDGWRGFLIIYWVSDGSATSLVSLVLGLLALAGTLSRLIQNKLDAWYVLGSIALLLLWPHPGQILRLLLPVVPILLIHAFLFCSSLLPGHGKCTVAILLFCLAAVLPAHAFLLGRLALADAHGTTPVYELFRRPNTERAVADMLLQNQMLADFSSLPSQLTDGDVTAYYMPEYLAILSKLPSQRLDYASPVASLDSATDQASHILLTAIHPRMSRPGVDGFQPEAELSTLSQPIWCSEVAAMGQRASCLYRITRQP
jgi:hypothetical protein